MWLMNDGSAFYHCGVNDIMKVFLRVKMWCPINLLLYIFLHLSNIKGIFTFCSRNRCRATTLI